MKFSFSFDQLLYALIGFIFLMITCRFLYYGSWHGVFIAWNILLAWIPYGVSKLFGKKMPRWKHRALFVFWLLFWPNALYIVTDLIHVNESRLVPAWFDAIWIFAAAVAGLMMAFVSLFRMEQFITGKLNSLKTNVLMIGILFLGSFGVYLGRFYRFNSWDILHDPIELSFSIASHVFSPQEHLHTWAVTAMLTVVFTLLYYSFKILPTTINDFSNKADSAVA